MWEQSLFLSIFGPASGEEVGDGAEDHAGGVGSRSEAGREAVARVDGELRVWSKARDEPDAGLELRECIDIDIALGKEPRTTTGWPDRREPRE